MKTERRWGCLVVEDDGVGREVNVIKGTGLGTRIVRAMAASFHADVAFAARNPGTAVTLSFALPA